MNVSCPECQSVFRVDPAKVSGAALRARCSVCGGLIAVGASVRWAEDFPDEMSSAPTIAPARARSAAPVGEQPAPADVEGRREGPVSEESDAGIPATPVARSTPAASEAPVPPAMPMPERAAVEPPTVSHTETAGADEGDAAAAPTLDPVVGGRVPPFFPSRRGTPAPPAFGAPAFPASTLRPPTPAFSPVIQGGAAAPSAPSTPAPSAPAPSAPAPSAPAPSAPAASAPAAEIPAAGKVGGAPSDAPSPRRPINPFLSNDPNQKARRLARALVSDMVAYHPQKHEEGGRNGTLRQLFRDEIKKSYEEYVEQVGRSLAESTTYFQDALNDVLADGKRIF